MADTARAEPYDLKIGSKVYMVYKGDRNKRWEGSALETTGTPVRIQVPRPHVEQGSRQGEWILRYNDFGQGAFLLDQIDRPGSYAVSNGVDAVSGAIELLGAADNNTVSSLSDAAPTKLITSEGLANHGSHVIKWNQATPAEDKDLLTQGFDIVEFQGEVFAGLATSTIHRRDSGGSWDTGNLSGVDSGLLTPKFFTVVEDKLWASSASNELYNTFADPETTTNWTTSGLPVGDTGSDITGLLGLESRVFVPKTDGLYVGDVRTGLFNNLTPGVVPDATNGVGSVVWDAYGVILYPTISGLYIVGKEGSVQPGGPERWRTVALSALGDGTHQFSGLTTDGQWVYGILTGGFSIFQADGTTNLLSSATATGMLVKGRMRRSSDSTPDPIKWHILEDDFILPAIDDSPFVAMTVTTYGSITDGFTTPAIHVAVDGNTSAAHLYSRLVPQGGLASMTAATALAVRSSGQFHAPHHDIGLPFTKKALTEVGVRADHLGINSSKIEMHVSVDGAAFTDLGDITTDNGTLSSTASGTRFMFKFVPTRGGTTTTKVRMWDFYARFHELTPHDEAFTANIIVADDLLDAEGDSPFDSAATMLTTLQGLYTSTQTVIDGITGISRTMKVAGPISEKRVFEDGGAFAGILVSIPLMEI